MTLILNLETSTKNCSVSISKYGKCMAYIDECSIEYLHMEKLHNFIEYIMKSLKISFKELQSICVSKGPGSYSSLRIGSSTAKGLCISLGIPLLSIDSLKVLIQNINIKNGMLIPMIYARQHLFYTALFDGVGNQLSKVDILNFDNLLKKIDERNKNYFIGNINFLSFEKKVLTKKKKYLSNVYPSAKNMSFLSYQKFCEKKFENIDTFSPFYL
ncbi:tRNA (adenosine(37)-N6)-threonylcarbamoyltransferase complex dimerization subunit type 1 TsaB [Blattabacterium cuenoti]|uniref:tRNA (adenosine(37)-N6)-threonylcarbamoyltransferase complex dimerization subunit type 1 TsaB n=1 Tax=Blattabacterium cuenoti TaxID=1653831 RepID=UPI00163CC5D0|nr:tRNA (adenosine(37)-N6)-threonylcarbamoyltransferase complex dimerization subunit type 1 TsaB [Blattabacterium cuenoti]